MRKLAKEMGVGYGMTLESYKERLERHDWYYMMSDDPRVYDSGKQEEDNLKKLAEGRKTYKEAYEKMERKMFPKK